MNNFNIRFNENSFTLPWHKEQYPEPDTVVICRVDQIDNKCGVYVNILNYGGIKGFISTKELSRKKIYSITSIMKVNEIKPFRVINIEKNRDQLYIDLSNKHISNAEDEVDQLEKYYRLITIFHTWLKYIHNAKCFLGGKYVGDLNDSLQMVANFEDNVTGGKLASPIKIKSTMSLSNIAYLDTETSSESADIVSAQENDESMYEQTDVKENTITPETQCSDDTSVSNNIKKIFPYGKNIWSKVMNLSLWTYPVGDIYDIFMDIKMKNKTICEAFPELISEIQKDNLTSEIDDEECLEITLKDIGLNNDLSVMDVISSTSLIGLIDKYINYDINIKINLKLTCWSIGSLDTIKNIISDIASIPKNYYDSQFSFASTIINSPSYEFVIKSTNKAIMDKIYPEGASAIDSELGEHLKTILEKYSDIDYDIELERKDIC
jgi:translation initiation factor 2 alpha subunit (eIF-2alpha)